MAQVDASSTSPITNIPDELIANIMKLALCHPTPLNHLGRLHFSHLRRVCQQWKAVGFTTPELWRNLDIEDLTYSVALKLEGWYINGGDPSAPRTLVVRDSSWTLEPAKINIPIFKVLLRYRWHQLGLFYLSGKTVGGVLGSAKAQTSVLKHLALSFTRIDPGCDFEISSNTFPSLTTLSLFGFSLNEPYVHIRHSTLVSIHLYRYSVTGGEETSAFASLLSYDSLPSLQEVIIQDCRLDPMSLFGSQAQTSTGSDQVTHSNQTVTRLTVYGLTSIHALDKMVLPSLKFLRLVDVAIKERRCFYHEHTENSTLHFIRRSTALLETFSLEDSSLDPPSIAKLINSLSQGDAGAGPPYLKALHITSAKVFNSGVNAERTGLLPALETLILMESISEAIYSLNGIESYFAAREMAYKDVQPVNIRTSQPRIEYARSRGRGTGPNFIKRKGNVVVEEVRRWDLHPEYPISHGHVYYPQFRLNNSW